jgi:hypothetical protein
MRHVPEPTRDSDHDAYCSPFPKLLTLATAAVQLFMAARAQGNQVGIFVRALLTALLSVMDLQIPLRATDLAPPVVPSRSITCWQSSLYEWGSNRKRGRFASIRVMKLSDPGRTGTAAVAHRAGI